MNTDEELVFGFQVGKGNVMSRMMIAASTLLLFVSAIRADDVPNPTSKSPGDQFELLLEEYERIGQAEELVGKFMALSQKYPKDPVAVDALIWVVKNGRRSSDLLRASKMLADDHIKSAKLGAVCQQLTRRPSLAAERLLRKMLEKSPHRNVRAQACFHLAASLKQQSTLIESLKAQPDLAKRFEQYYGKDFTKHLASVDEDSLAKEIERLYQRVVESFAAVCSVDQTMGQTAKKELFRIRHLSLGRAAPEIKGEDIEGEQFELSDYHGKIVLLDFWGHW